MATTDAQFHGTSRFRIVSRIGVSASSAVYKAIDEKRGGGFVALRTLPPLPAGRTGALQQEFRGLRNVRHPSLVSLDELAESDGTWFYTMELVEGVSLRAYVRQLGESAALTDEAGGTFDETRLRSALGQLVRALVALHDGGRIHGNLEPTNLRVTAQGRLVLLDACLLPEWLRGEEAELSVLRALPFVAPERLEGRDPSAQTDWYGVGALLYEALSGTPPFAETTGVELTDAKYGVVPVLPNAPQLPEDLVKLCRDLLSHDPDGRPTDEEVLQRLGLRRELANRPSKTFSAVGDEGPFVGRKRELSLLAEAFERTRHGSVSPLCLSGEPGVGKRTLAIHLGRRLRKEYPHLVQLSGRCHRHGPSAFRGVREVVDALSRYLATEDASAVATLLPQDAALLPQIFPSLHRVGMASEPTTGLPQEPAAVRRQAFRALRRLLHDLSQRHPLLIVLEDVQWADADAVALLDQLVSPPDPPDMLLLLLINGRPTEASPPVRRWLSRREDLVTHMQVRELSRRAARELAERLLGASDVNDEAAAIEIVEQTRGHPMWIDALAHHRILYEHLPPERTPLLELMRARIERLPGDTRHVLDLLCAARIPVPPQVLSEAAQQGPEETARHLGTLRVLNLARALRGGDNDRVAPHHELVTQALEATWSDSDQRRLHRALAAAMSGWAQAPRDVLSDHWLLAGDRERGGRTLAQAAQVAREQLAFAAAVHLYQRAISYGQGAPTERHALRVHLAHAYANAGQGERAARAYLEAARGADAGSSLELQRRAALQLLRSGLLEEGAKVARDVLEAMGIRLPETSRSALASLLLHRLQLQLRGTRFRERDPLQIPPNQLIRADILASLASAIGTVDNVRGADAHTRHLLLTLKLGEPRRVARALAIEAGYLAGASGPHREAWMRALEQSSHLAHRSSDSQARAFGLAVQSTASFLSGAFRDNVDLSIQADRALTTECSEVDHEIGTNRVYQAVSRFYLGDLRQLASQVREQIREARERGDHYTHTNLRIAVGYLPLLMDHEPRRAAALLDEAIRSWGRASFQIQHAFYVLGRAQVDAYQSVPGAYARTLAAWPHLVDSLLLRVAMVEHTARHLRGRAALSDARLYPEQREALLRDAAACAGHLMREPVGYANGWGYALRAGVAFLRGDDQGAIRHLQRAEAQFYENEMGVYAAAARLRLADLLPPREGRPLATRATDWFMSQGVRRPQRFADMLLPGLR